MSYVLSMSSTIKAFQDGLDATLEEEASLLGDMLVEKIAAHTPVGRRVNEDGEDVGASGALKRNWKKRRVRRTGDRTWETGASNDKEYASWVNDGTRAHIIEPRPERRAKAAAEGRNVSLRFWSHAEMLFRARVHHPGTRGRYMVEKGAADVQHDFPSQAEQRMRQRARQAEVHGEQTAERR